MIGNDSVAPLIRKLLSLGEVSEEEMRALQALPSTIRDMPSGHEMVRENDRPSQSCLMLSGMCCRFKIVGEGARQINSFHIPGDMPDLQSLFLHKMDHGLAMLTRSRVALIPHAALLQLIGAYPRLGLLFWRDTLIDGSIFREWMCSIGRRPALVRIAHLICEMFVRYRTAGLVDGMAMPFHLTQTNIGDAQGLSVVHVNRVMKELKEGDLIAITERQLSILDWDGLTLLADFDDAYLHLSKHS